LANTFRIAQIRINADTHGCDDKALGRTRAIFGKSVYTALEISIFRVEQRKGIPIYMPTIIEI